MVRVLMEHDPSTATRVCALCRTDGATLLDSHVVPSWAYQRILAFHPVGGRNPVAISQGKAVLTSSQNKKRLLCRACEELFGRSEDYTAQQVLQPNGDFPAFRGLTGGGTEVGPCRVSTLNAEYLARFALSVFWRADVVSSHSNAIVTLGPEREAVREYLCGSASLPPRIEITAKLLTQTPANKQVSRVMTDPETSSDNHHIHDFLIFGIKFIMHTGGNLLDQCRAFSLVREGIVMVADGVKEREAILHETLLSVPRGTLSKNP